jgi:putative heme iron utilization protein
MSVDNPPTSATPSSSGASATGTAVRRLLRTALKGSLATLDRSSGHPYASLVLIATEPQGDPILFISKLALHTRNLEADPRASLLLDGTGDRDDPLSGDRVTLTGEARPTDSPTALRRFLARHASAKGYTGLPDFRPFTLTVTGAHYIGGFGRIVDLAPPTFMSDLAGADALVAAEEGIVAHMNSDHADAIELYATRLAGEAPGAWRMTGIDPAGIDLLHRNKALRIDFQTPVRTATEARMALVAMVKEARQPPQPSAA